MATAYQNYTITGLLVRLRGHLPADLYDKCNRKIPEMSNADADLVIGILMDMKEVCGA